MDPVCYNETEKELETSKRKTERTYEKCKEKPTRKPKMKQTSVIEMSVSLAAENEWNNRDEDLDFDELPRKKKAPKRNRDDYFCWYLCTV
jgi:hypothetical protein